MARRILLLALLLLPGCSSVVHDSAPDGPPVDLDSIPDAVPKAEPRSRYGNPSDYVVFGERYQVMDDSRGFRQRGEASWYGTKFHGRRTSSGEAYDMYAMTAAHKSLPLPTYLRVTNLDNRRSIVVRVNDRGPFHGGRIIDLSYVAALKLGIVATGTAPVEIVALEPGQSGESGVTVRTAANPEPLRAEPLPEPEQAAVTPPEHSLAMSASAAAELESEYFIQLGAFGVRSNAEALSQELAAAGFAPVGIHPEAALHRVRLGPLASRKAAEEITLRLIAHGIEQFRIVEQPR